MSGVTRRRFITIAAAAFAAPAGAATAFASAPPMPLWRGVALGARAEIRIDGLDASDAAEIIAACRREIDRLENLFSLYRADSAIAQLNRTGVLRDPDPEFLALLSTAASVNRATGGLFDPTIQPLWDAYASLRGTGDNKATDEIAEQFGNRVGFEHLHFGPAEITFKHPGMALTLNGIAQGYVTDKIANVMYRKGLRNVLVNVGELRAVGGLRDGRGWPVRISGAADGDFTKTMRLKESALATSATNGTTFDAARRIGHIFDPRDCRPASQQRQVSIEAPSATLADALSTALCLMSEEEAISVVGAFPDTRLRAMG
jgi:FAD:protein FMN transferase